jgi:hypothetical protein
MRKEMALRAAEYRAKVQAQKTVQALDRTSVMEEMKEVLATERGERFKAAVQEEHEWRAKTPMERSITPGPGHYKVEGGAIQSTARGWRAPPSPAMQMLAQRSPIDDLPAPGAYGVPRDDIVRSGSFTNAAKFSTANPKSYLDLARDKSAVLPAPGDYGAPLPPTADLAASRTPKFSEFRAKSFLDLEVAKHKDKPGPGGLLLDDALALPGEAGKASSKTRVTMASFLDPAAAAGASPTRTKSLGQDAMRARSASPPHSPMTRKPTLKQLEAALQAVVHRTDFTDDDRDDSDATHAHGKRPEPSPVELTVAPARSASHSHSPSVVTIESLTDANLLSTDAVPHP